MEYTQHEYACHMPKLNIGDALLFKNSKMTIIGWAEFEDGSKAPITEITLLEDGIWKKPHETKAHISLIADCKRRLTM